MEHLTNMILDLTDVNTFECDTDQHVLFLAALYHDIVYIPNDKFNENRSISILIDHWVVSDLIRMVIEVIQSTESLIYDPNEHDNNCPKYIIDRFKRADCSILYSLDIMELIQYENKIRKEFQKINYADYKKGRLEFLKQAFKLTNNELLITQLYEYVENYVPSVGLYVGSFNPFHKGHLSVVNMAEKMFDKVIVAIGDNDAKNNDKLIWPNWIDAIPNQVVRYHGLTTDLIKSLEESGLDVTLIRGIRNSFDLDHESNLIKVLTDLKPDLKYIMLFGDQSLSHISSTTIRSLYKLNKEHALKYMVGE
jgi:pantetheine-phosphate adenylyltransferase